MVYTPVVAQAYPTIPLQLLHLAAQYICRCTWNAPKITSTFLAQIKQIDGTAERRRQVDSRRGDCFLERARMGQAWPAKWWSWHRGLIVPARERQAGRRSSRETVPGRELGASTEAQAERWHGRGFSPCVEANGFSCESFPFRPKTLAITRLDK